MSILILAASIQVQYCCLRKMYIFTFKNCYNWALFFSGLTQLETNIECNHCHATSRMWVLSSSFSLYFLSSTRNVHCSTYLKISIGTSNEEKQATWPVAIGIKMINQEILQQPSYLSLQLFFVCICAHTPSDFHWHSGTCLSGHLN